MSRTLRAILMAGSTLLLVVSAFLPAPAEARVAATLGERATLIDNGQAVVVTVTVACAPPRLQVIEAFAYVTQDGATSTFAAIPLACAGRARTYAVRVPIGPDQAPFHLGAASASAYLLLAHPATGATQSASPTRAITIQ